MAEEPAIDRRSVDGSAFSVEAAQLQPAGGHHHHSATFRLYWKGKSEKGGLMETGNVAKV